MFQEILKDFHIFRRGTLTFILEFSGTCQYNFYFFMNKELTAPPESKTLHSNLSSLLGRYCEGAVFLKNEKLGGPAINYLKDTPSVL